MKYLVFLAITVLSSVSMAADYQIIAPPSWTAELGDPEPEVTVDAWFTEGAFTVTEGVFVGPMAAGETRDINTVAFLGSGRTICVNAYVERTGQPDTRVTAVPACRTFPLFILVPPTLLAP